MEKGMFTKKEQEYLMSLDAVKGVSPKIIIYSEDFKSEFMKKYNAGCSPSKIFADAGLSSDIIGYKRIEKASSRWREAFKKGLIEVKED